MEPGGSIRRLFSTSPSTVDATLDALTTDDEDAPIRQERGGVGSAELVLE